MKVIILFRVLGEYVSRKMYNCVKVSRNSRKSQL